ncbi:MAG TPA: hypothetical protein DDX71_04825 [Ruminococcus sp.]|nr:hypothetical protein [Ruminococcus sp.]
MRSMPGGCGRTASQVLFSAHLPDAAQRRAMTEMNVHDQKLRRQIANNAAAMILLAFLIFPPCIPILIGTAAYSANARKNRQTIPSVRL